MNSHWTEKNIAAFRYRITSDFLMQLERKMQTEKISQKKLAQALRVSPGRVSQILNGEMSNFELDSVIRYARGVGMKVSLVAYDDDDPDNTRGPVDSEIFTLCWEHEGKPLNHFDLNEKPALGITGELASGYQENGTSTGTVVPFSTVGTSRARLDTNTKVRRVATR